MTLSKTDLDLIKAALVEDLADGFVAMFSCRHRQLPTPQKH